MAKIVNSDGKEVSEYNMLGELFVQSPAVTLGYLNNERATAQTYIQDKSGRWP
jgi:acyl-CoA synthetase (AMP-forming)/AMP-acid ligase II